MTLLFDRFDSPIGVLTIAGDERGLSHVLFPENRHPARGREDWHYAPDALPEARDQLLQFLHGERNSFDLVLAPRGTPFQLRVWQALALIPFGQTWSYLQPAQCDPCGRRCQRPQPAADHPALPSRDRQQRCTDRFRRRTANQGRAVAAGTTPGTAVRLRGLAGLRPAPAEARATATAGFLRGGRVGPVAGDAASTSL